MQISELRALVSRGLSRMGFASAAQTDAGVAAPIARPPVLNRYQLDRLRLLAEKPRAYAARDSVNPVLERLSLVKPTRRVDPIRGRRVWEITDTGRSHLEQATK